MLKHHTSLRTTILTSLVAASSLGLTTAHAQTLASGQASLTNIRFELIDLTPDDGQTPWIRFGSASEPIGGLVDATGLSHLPESARQEAWQGGILPTQAITATSADGFTQAQATANSLGTSFKVTPATLAQTVAFDNGRQRVEVFSQVRTGNGIASLAYEVNETTGEVTAVDGETGWQPFDFTLSANTGLVIHAQASASLSIGGLLANTLAAENAAGGEVSVGSGVQIALMLTDPTFSMKPSYASTDAFYEDMDKAYQLSFDGLSADWTPDDLASLTPSSRDLMVTLGNHTGVEARGSLLMTGMSQFAVTTAVPEPGTWAFMGLGLLAMLGRVRKAPAA